MTKDVDLSGRVALITGASRGIGAAAAKGLAASGAHVILLARTVGGLEEVDDEIRAAGGKATLIPMDLRSEEDIIKLGPTIAGRFKRLDIFIGNAGMLGPLSPVHHIDMKDWQAVMELNLMANIRLIKTLDPLLRDSDAGRAVFTTAGAMILQMGYYGPYAASKAALNAFAQMYAAETKQTAMRVNLLSPGPVETGMLHEAFPGGYQGDKPVRKPEEIAGDFLALCAPDCERHGEIVGL